MQCLCSYEEDKTSKMEASEKEYEINFNADWNAHDDIDQTAEP